MEQPFRASLVQLALSKCKVERGGRGEKQKQK